MTAPNTWELGIDDSGYPAALRALQCPPKRIYGVGDPALLTPALGVVGARKATPYGISCTREFAGWAASRGVTIVSGAAIGCDLEAHRAALEACGPTVAVLGCGADVDYPTAASPALARIRHEGAVISELPWGTPPGRRHFVPRNRIIAALSAALLVVEAGVPSGTFTTADFALDMGRDVLAVPGSIHSPGSRGPNRLLRQGAFLVAEIADLAASLRTAGLAVDDPDGVLDPGPSGDEVLDALAADPMRPDDLALALHEDIVPIARRLAALEEAGLVVRFRDGRYGPPERPRRQTERLQCP